MNHAHADELSGALGLPEHFERDKLDRVSSTHAVSVAPLRLNRRARTVGPAQSPGTVSSCRAGLIRCCIRCIGGTFLPTWEQLFRLFLEFCRGDLLVDRRPPSVKQSSMLTTHWPLRNKPLRKRRGWPRHRKGRHALQSTRGCSSRTRWSSSSSRKPPPYGDSTG